MRDTGSGRFITVLVSAGVLLALGATAFAEAPAVDPCKFLTPAEVESVMGKKLKGAPALKMPGHELLGDLADFVDEVIGKKERVCSYEFTNTKSTLSVGIMAWDILTQSPKPAPGVGSLKQVKVNGLGDEAMLDQRRGNIVAGLKALWGVKEDGGAMDREESGDVASLSLHIRKGKLAMTLAILDDAAGDEEKLKVLEEQVEGVKVSSALCGF